MPVVTGDHPLFDLTLPPVFPDDVDQEIWILRNQGKNPRRDLVRKRLESRVVEGLFSDIPSGISLELPWIDYRPVSLESIEVLVEWSLSQVKEVQQVIWNFLEDPDDQLEKTLQQLQELGIVLQAPRSKPQVTIKALILKALPATFDELVELVLMVSPNTRRPEATVRQFIRRHQKSGLVKVVNEVVYYDQ